MSKNKGFLVPPLNALKAFNCAAKYENFSKAAEELHVTSTAISHQISNLEEWFGVELFKKKGRSVMLTQTGHELKHRTGRVFDELADIATDFKVRGRKSSLVVGCIPSIATRWLVPNLKSFTKLYPDVEVQVLYVDMRDQLAGSTYDVLITYIEQESDDVIEIPFISRNTYAVCSPKFLEEYGPFDEPKDLLRSEVIHDENKDGWTEWFKLAGVDVEGGLPGNTYADFNLLVISAIAGHGVALCPIDAFREEIKRGDLVTLFDIASNTDKFYNICKRKDASKDVMSFVEWFVDVCK
ncbi:MULTISPECIES: LysR substrate-binding domain-containing protein [Vibrio]|jgi:LysR family glycine cleavage system transcriptional activator|uniref:LysR family transcriptional regulator n=1 Tax=Vibrio natriegens NBRC 15636 = ATCC 14048 = DSM 759 TaxID=1219067 RepID=A0AAN0Y6C2_VIBNA|nr:MULTISPECIES: LysR substrate-binding domain-containing protein [Vibrio]MEE3877536.1 LysR substrate-binding domain-containing protein [Vibrio sp. YYF0003]CAH0527823.1 Glycine cleavage system transcriptional activator [Catenococcus thiocycli]ALR17462.1 LysR family transcriptional regulator [Vibrio natriegens NBRC 15636 = ATCC 14048 = DSM 759]ANQ14953.1 LysR family transcriptional regulator [Vibrio natriegens NBRC 15636 = ATCC 14048 = DSM 759]ANQ28436.1 LysR family transcriptional regulator [V